MGVRKLGRASMSQTTTQNLLDRTATKVTFNVVDGINGGPTGNKVATIGSSQITINYDGLYLVSGGYKFANPGNDWKITIGWFRNTRSGVPSDDYFAATTGANSTNTFINNSFYYELLKGDIISMYVYQGLLTGATLNTCGGTGDTTYLEVTLIDKL